jgi:type VI secretion system protein
MVSRNSHHAKPLLLLLCLALLALSPACRRVPAVIRNTVPGASGASMLETRVQISPGANQNNPVAVDLVLVSNQILFKELMKLSAKEWFEKRNQFQLDYPKETELSTRRWEWVPGQVVKLDRILVKIEITGGIIFANYFTPGTHRAVIDPRKKILIKLGEEDFTVQVLK